MPGNAWLSQMPLAGEGSPGEQAAGLLLIDPKRRLVFLALRSEGVSNPGMWAIPGGKVETGETPLEAALRETEEEIGGVPAHEVVGKKLYRSGSFLFTTFICHVMSGVVDRFKPELDEESDDAAWFQLDYLPSPILPNVIAVIGSLGSQRLI